MALHDLQLTAADNSQCRVGAGSGLGQGRVRVGSG